MAEQFEVIYFDFLTEEYDPIAGHRLLAVDKDEKYVVYSGELRDLRSAIKPSGQGWVICINNNGLLTFISKKIYQVKSDAEHEHAKIGRQIARVDNDEHSIHSLTSIYNRNI